MEFQVLPQSFYAPSAKIVAARLLGHWLIRRTPGGFCGGPIVETEAYLRDDPACHGFKGETARNRTMFGPPGFAYVYYIYGAHFCVNAVCHRIGSAEAVLIRAIEAEFGLELMREFRPAKLNVMLTNGPGKLCAALNLQRGVDGAALFDPASELIIARNPRVRAFRNGRGPVVITTRVGISLAAEMGLRFYLEKSPFISRRERALLPRATA